MRWAEFADSRSEARAPLATLDPLAEAQPLHVHAVSSIGRRPPRRKRGEDSRSRPKDIGSERPKLEDGLAVDFYQPVAVDDDESGKC